MIKEYEKIRRLEAEKLELIEMIKTLTCSFAGPVQTRDEAVELYNKHSAKRFYHEDEEYQRKRLAEEETQAAA